MSPIQIESPKEKMGAGAPSQVLSQVIPAFANSKTICESKHVAILVNSIECFLYRVCKNHASF